MGLSPRLRQTGSKISSTFTPDYWTVRRCSPGFGVLESSLQCVLLSIFGSQPGPFRRNEHPAAESSRSADKGDGQLPKWLVGDPGAVVAAETQFQRCCPCRGASNPSFGFKDNVGGRTRPLKVARLVGDFSAAQHLILREVSEARARGPDPRSAPATCLEKVKLPAERVLHIDHLFAGLHPSPQENRCSTQPSVPLLHHEPSDIGGAILPPLTPAKSVRP